MRYPPPDPLHLFSSGGARDATSLTAIARQIAAARTTLPAPTSQSSSFVALRPSQAGSTTGVADRASPRSHLPSYSPSHSHSSRSSSRAEHAGEVLLQMFAGLSEQLSAKLAAQSSALTSVMQRFEKLHSATPPRRSRRPARQPSPASRSPSRRASTSPQRFPHRQSALEVDALQGVTLPFPARPLAQDPRATAHQQAPLPLARFASPTSLVSHASLVSASSTQSLNSTESLQSGLLIAPLALPALCCVASFACTVRSTVFNNCTARRKYSGGAVCAATGHHICAVRIRASSVLSAAQYGRSRVASRSAAQYGRSDSSVRSPAQCRRSASSDRSAAQCGSSVSSVRSAAQCGRSACSARSASQYRRSACLSRSAARRKRSIRDASRGAALSARRRLG